MAAYSSDQDWTDEAEAEQAAVSRRPGALGLPIVTALLGLLVGVLGTSLWWSWAGTPSSSRVAAAPSAAAPAPATKLSATAKPAAPPTVAVITPPPSPVVATTTAPPGAEDTPAVSLPSPPSAGPASSAAAGPSPEEVARRRERAWARFYKRPSICEGNPTTDQLIECGNHYIRMRREFDERWRAGSL